MPPRTTESAAAPEALSSASRHEADFAALIDLTRALAKQEDIYDILFSVVSRLADILEVDRGSIVLRQREEQQEGEEAERAVVVASSDDVTLRNRVLALNKYPEIRQVLKTGEVLIIRDVTESSLLTDVLKTEGSLAFSSMALLPIVVGGSAIAVLCLKRGSRADFSDYDIMHASAVASATAIALDNARVLRTLRAEANALFSARSQDEVRLRELTRYLEIFQSSRDAMLVIDNEGKILFANPMAAQIARLDSERILDFHLADLLEEQDQGIACELLTGFSSGQYPAGIDLQLKQRVRGQKGTTVSVNFSAMPDKNGSVLASLRDVTRERGLARELSQTKEFLERVIESSVDSIVSAGLDGRVLVFNRSASLLFGYEQEDVIGKLQVEQLYPPGVAKEIMRKIKGEEGGGVGFLSEERVEMLTQQGECVPVNLSASLVMDGDRAVGTVGIFTDIRTRLAMEARLADAQRALHERQRQDTIAEVAGAAAHELNQPLTSVLGYAEYLKRGVCDDPQLTHAVEVIMSETQRMADIVRKVGRITRYETKPYVGGAKIVDIDRSSTPES